MKKILLIFFILCLSLGRSSAFGAAAPSNIQTQAPAIQPQLIDYSQCNKIFQTNNTKLFYLTLSSVNANRFKIDEIQSKSGYVLFTAASREFLASVHKIDNTHSILKITPTNGNYYFPAGIVQNFFKYIELNLETPVEKLNII